MNVGRREGEECSQKEAVPLMFTERSWMVKTSPYIHKPIWGLF
jgi:hypothetical protein